MKFFICSMSIVFSNVLLAQGKPTSQHEKPREKSAAVSAVKSTPETERDYAWICEVSKFALSLKGNKHFSEPAERALIVATVLEKELKVQQTKDTLKAVMVAAPMQKAKFMRQAAKDAGLKNWFCSSLSALF